MYRLLAIFISFALMGTATAYENPISGNSKAAGKDKQFHKDVSIIRKMHPEFLDHKRDETLRHGVRTREHSLKGCVWCHTNTDASTNKHIPVNNKDQFCSDCHQKVSVSVDCFQCHRTTPSKGAK